MKEFSQRYRNYQINCACEHNFYRDVYACRYKIYINNKLQLKFIYVGSEEYLLERFSNIESLSKLRDEGFDLAYGLIDAEKYKEFKEGKVLEFGARNWQLPEESEITDEEIQHKILKALDKIRKEKPDTYKSEEFNRGDGFCKVLRIAKNDFSKNISYLEDNRLIKKDEDYIYIRPEGIYWLEQERYKYRIIDPITSEIQKFVHERLKEINPNIFNSLERIKQQLIEEEKDFKWQQVAFECRDIIQDFTHSLYRPEYLPDGEKAPKKPETKRKLKFILENRLNKSENTERELIEGLIEYLYKYFDCINSLIQKGVHRDIEKSDAERCLIYTYLFIGDVLSLTKL